MTSRYIEFHDGYLVGHRSEPDGSLCLSVQLDSVWNDGSSRIVRITLSGIANMSEVAGYFAPIKLGPLESDAYPDDATEFEVEPTVLELEMLELDGIALVSLDLLSWGELNVVCERVESGERSLFRFVT